MVNQLLPPDLRDYDRVLDKKGIAKLLEQVADRYPNRYKEIVQGLMNVGRTVAYSSGHSFSLKDLRPSTASVEMRRKLRQRLDDIYGSSMDDQDKDAKVVEMLTGMIEDLKERTYQEGLDQDNPFALQVLSGSRGSPANLSSLKGADLLVADHKDRPVPVPILNNYSTGLSPAEYWAASYGARKGLVNVKESTAQAGFYGKQLANASNRLIVTDEEPLEGTGLPVDVDDPDNEGAALAETIAGYDAGTILTPRIMSDIKRRSGRDKILVHSPISAGGHGVPRLAAGVRERGGLPPIGDNIGIAAAQALSERLSQGQLESKHSAGVVGSGRASNVQGFKAIEQLTNIPKTFQGAATVAEEDGRVGDIVEAPQGGYYVTIGGTKHYVSEGLEPIVEKGEEVEAGDVLSQGTPNPADIVRFKGIGEGRYYLARAMKDMFERNGMPAHRRNAELIARGLINHVRITDPDGVGDYLPDDVVEYDALARSYKPRPGSIDVTPARAKGRFLEKPVLHYSVGTRITPRRAKELSRYGVKNVTVHDDDPPFEPEMIRSMETLLHDPDWQAMMGGFFIRKGLTERVHRGGKSSVHSRSPFPALAQPLSLGRQLKTKGVY